MKTVSLLFALILLILVVVLTDVTESRTLKSRIRKFQRHIKRGAHFNRRKEKSVPVILKTTKEKEERRRLMETMYRDPSQGL